MKADFMKNSTSLTAGTVRVVDGASASVSPPLSSSLTAGNSVLEVDEDDNGGDTDADAPSTTRTVPFLPRNAL